MNLINDASDIGAIIGAGQRADTLQELTRLTNQVQSHLELATHLHQQEQARKELLFQITKELDRIESVYRENPAQGYYDTLMVGDILRVLDTSDFSELDWKTTCSTATERYTALANHGQTVISEKHRRAAIEAYGQTQETDRKRRAATARKYALARQERKRKEKTIVLVTVSCAIVGFLVFLVVIVWHSL
ncbi:MAG: hypothetical protein FJ276_28670 [Planctomycetes bacterium]|nr:hypothetical protein [Planctomycetota bacterium]